MNVLPEPLPDDSPGPPQRSPAGLGRGGKKLWRSISGVWDLDPREADLLEQACRTRDLIDRLEVLLDTDGLIVAGSAGQPRLNAVVTEVRQQRVTLDKLLNSLSLPDSAAPRISRRQQLNSQRRWGVS